ncbi:SCO family protein [Sandarakinorhabdus sp.]|uniref:SCO family protein n=1 Tax=Sandarakinorhabdus sp. TaxID=1916663 RepID=UPI00286EAC4D|nr:SCO family protein [Sandarakinorhabdus sp.]
MNRRLWLLVLVPVLLAGLLGYMHFAAAPPGNLDGASIGGAFSLIDQTGRKVTDKDFAGQYRLIYFGYTFCPDVCPTDVAMMTKGLNAFAASNASDAAKVQPIFITIDPVRDTPAALAPFVAAFHPRLIGLTGTPAQIAAVSRTFGVYGKRMPGGDDQNYLMDHSAMLYLFGPDGAPIAFLPHQGLDAAQVRDMLATYVR